MNPQVFTTTTSAPSASGPEGVAVLVASLPSMRSLSTVFFGQPRETNARVFSAESAARGRGAVASGRLVVIRVVYGRRDHRGRRIGRVRAGAEIHAPVIVRWDDFHPLRPGENRSIFVLAPGRTGVMSLRCFMPRPGPWVGYAVAVVATAAVAAGRLAFDYTFGEGAHFLTPFAVPVMLAAWVGGGRPGLIAAGLNAGVIAVLFLNTESGLDLTDPADRVRVGVLAVVCLFVIVACERSHRYRVAAEAAAAGLARELTERQQTERQLLDNQSLLSESEERYRALLEGVPQLVWTCRPDGWCDYLSRQWVEYTGIPEADQLGYRWADVVHPDDRAGLLADWRRAVDTGVPLDVEFRIRSAAGAYRWFRTRAHRFRLSDGSDKWLGTNTDIDDIRRAADELRVMNQTLEARVANRAAELAASEERFRALFEQASDALFLGGPARVVSDANDRACASLGYTRAELLGLPFARFDSFVSPDRLAWVDAELAAGRAATFESRHRRKDGTTFPVEVRVGRITLDGRTHHLSVARDVSDRVRAEEALRRSEQRFRATFHSQFQFIGLMSPAGTLLEANRSALVAAGVSEADVLGKPFWETAWWTHDRDQQERLKLAVRRAAGGEQDRFEASHPVAGGGRMWVDFSLTPFWDAGEVVLLIPEGRDITDRKRIEAALVEQEERFRAFMDHLPLAAWAADADGRLVLANRFLGGLLGRPADEVIGLTRFDLLAPADARAHEAVDRRVRETGRAEELDEQFARPDGTTGYSFSVKFPVRRRTGRPWSAGWRSTSPPGRRPRPPPGRARSGSGRSWRRARRACSWSTATGGWCSPTGSPSASSGGRPGNWSGNRSSGSSPIASGPGTRATSGRSSPTRRPG